MTSHEIGLIQNSYRQLIHVSDQAGAIFFARLFELDPSFRTLFPDDLQIQGQQMFQTVRYFVTSLDQLPQTLAAMRRAGMDRADLPIPEKNYHHFCDALLWTLAKCLGRNFTLELRATWSKAYWLLAEAMINGSRDGAMRPALAVA